MIVITEDDILTNILWWSAIRKTESVVYFDKIEGERKTSNIKESIKVITLDNDKQVDRFMADLNRAAINNIPRFDAVEWKKNDEDVA